MRRELCLLLGLLACGNEEPEPIKSLPPLAPTTPFAPGPYGVGVTTLHVDDGRAAGRTLPIEIWYPASITDSDPVTRYPVAVGELVLAEIASPLGAVRDAPLDRHGAPHPVIVFSHGYGGTRVQSVYLTEYLVTHGFVVAAPDHTGNTFAEVFTDTNLPAVDLARLRPGDVSRTLDVLLERSARFPDDALGYAADERRVGVAGHSFGGFTTLRIAGATIDVDAATAICAQDPGEFFCEGWPGQEPLPSSQRDDRFLAALPQAPGGTRAFELNQGVSDVAVPTMIQAGTIDTTTPFDEEALPVFDDLPPPAYLLALKGAVHFTFSDICALMQQLMLEVAQFDDGCSEHNIPWADAHRVIDWMGTAFALKYVAQDETFASELDAMLPAFATMSAK